MVTREVTFDDAPPPGTINLGVGQPSADLLPVDLVRKAAECFFDGAVPFEFNYGNPQGDVRFLDSLAQFLSEAYDAPASADNLIVTGGNSQAMDLVSTVFARSGDTVFVEEPSYYLAFQIFRDHGLNVVGLPLDEGSVSIDALQAALASVKPAFLYTIPSYHNPTGLCCTEARRRELIDLGGRHDFRIIADEPYQLLSFYNTPPQAYGAMIDNDVVVSLGSFSKILAPAMRLGWIQTSRDLMDEILVNGFLRSGGSINHLSSHIVRHAIDNGLLAPHVEKLRKTYRYRVEAMDEALHEHFDGLATWTKPQGGYFFWLRFDESVDASQLREEATQRQAGFQPGPAFSSNGNFRNCLRLSFSHYDEDDIREGIARIRSLFD